MKINHVALIATSEEKADRFYFDILGLKKAVPKTVEASLSLVLFNLNFPLTYLSYYNDDLRFEIFILPERQVQFSPSHVCLEVNDRESLLSKCLASGLPVKRLIKEGKEIVFISDFDGHLFEIKEIQR